MTFTERFINDTIYDGVDSLKASYFEYKGKKIYAFPSPLMAVVGNNSIMMKKVKP